MDRKFTTIAVSKDMLRNIDGIVKNSNGMYRTKAEFINAALREKIEKIHDSGIHASKKHDPAVK